MEITTASIIGLSKSIGEWVARIATSHVERKREYFDVLLSVQDALTVTRSYIARIERGSDRDLEKEEALSHLWNSVSLGLYKVGESGLAERCGLKGYYWASPDSWKETDYPNAGIEVDKVFNDVRVLLDKHV